MADPIVHITNGIPDVGTGNITTLGMTLLDGANATLGAITDLAVTAGATGSINAHLRSISRDLAGGVVLQTGANTIGAVTQAGAPWSISGTVSVSGTVTVTGTVAATQSGTWNINNISGTISLPTGAATAAKQPALGTAGTPSADVITVQGATSMTPLKVDNSGVTQPISGNVGITGNVNCVQVTSPWVTSVSGNVTCVQSGNWTSRCVGNAGGIFDFSSAQNIATPGQAILIGAEFNAVPTTITTGNSSPLQLDTNANLLVNVKTGTIAATQSGTWNINNVSGTVSLPTGAATSANQTTAAAQGSTTSGQTGPLVQGAVTTGSPAYTTGQTSPLSLDTSGNLRVNVVAGGGAGGTSSTFNATFPSTGTAAGAEYLSSPPTLTTGQMVALQTDVNGNLKVNIQAGAGSGGTASTVGGALPGQGTLAMGSVTTSAPSYTTATANSLSLNTAGGLRVDGSGVTQPISGSVSVTGTTTVSGTVTANQGGAPWTVKPDGTAWAMTSTSANVNVTNASIAVTGTFWQATQPISAASLPLPSGAATSANQPTNVAAASTTSGQTGGLAFGAVTTAAPAYTTAQSNPLSLTTVGNLRVDGSSVTQPISGNVGVTGSVAVTGTFWQTTQPVSGTVTANQGGAPWTMKPDGTVWALTSTSANVNVTNTVPVRINGSAGGIIDFSSAQNVATPNSAILTGAEYNSTPTAITTGNASPLQSDKQGRLLTVGAIRAAKGRQKTSITVSTAVAVVSAGAAGIFNDVYAIVITNKSATSVTVDINDGAAVVMTLAAPAGDTRGFTVPVDSAIPQAGAAAAWTATVSSAVTSIEITMLYVSNI